MEKEPKWLEIAHKRTGKPKETLKKMSWSKVERLLGIEIREPPKELKNHLKGGYFARRKRWITQKEIDSMYKEVDRLVQKFGSRA